MSKYVLLANLSYLPDFGGVENSLRHLCSEYRKLGFTPIILTCQSSDLRYKPCEKIGDAVVIRSCRMKGVWGAVITLLGMARFSISLAKKRSFCVVISRNQISSLFVRTFIEAFHVYLAPGFAQFQTSNENMQTKELSTVQKILKSIKRNVNGWLDKQALVKSHRVYLFSANMLEQARIVLGKKSQIAEKFIITKPGVKSTRFLPSQNIFEKLQLREKYNLPKHEFLFLCIGRLVAAKGFDLAIKAMKDQDTNCTLVVIGDGPERESLEALAVEEGVGDKVIFKGSTNFPEEYYRLSDAFLMTSRYEPLGQTILEAAATGLPIISFKNGATINSNIFVTNATYEIVGDLGDYVERYDEKVLADKMNEIIARKDLNLISDSLRELVQTQFSWNSLAQSLTRKD
ncbi:MAG: hypothetical protein COB00_07350 [Alcanivorax sp.]|nr:MAG: hypothetical protein COB00_07350 [Alcanivorax sp.]